MNIILKGGILMYPIILCSVLSLAIIMERLIFYKSARKNPQKLMEDLKDFINRGRVKEALERCDKDNTPLAKVLKAGVLKYDQSREVIEENMKESALYEMPRLEKHLSFLATIAHISPLLGLLGTVLGLVRCFYTIEIKLSNIGFINPQDLAGGIWEALLTTAAGLIVAIPSYVAYNYFVYRVNFLTSEIERVSNEFVSFLTEEVR